MSWSNADLNNIYCKALTRAFSLSNINVPFEYEYTCWMTNRRKR